MLEEVHSSKPFKDADEKARVRHAIKMHYKGLKFLYGSDLYHTRLVNNVMDNLLVDEHRQKWIADLSIPTILSIRHCDDCSPPATDCEQIGDRGSGIWHVERDNELNEYFYQRDWC
jgi:hypothetical protein